MKKLSLIFAVAFMAVTFVSCNKKTDDTFAPQKQYASAISGQFNVTDGDIILKSAPIGSKREWTMLRKFPATSSVWAAVDGTEFLPGSIPALDWSQPNINPFMQPNLLSGNFTHCPVLPLKVVTKTMNAANDVIYLGVLEMSAPSANGFNINMKGRRLGDELYLNVDALTSLPGYTSMKFTVSYTKSPIDIPGTVLNTTSTTSGWPTYAYGTNTAGSYINTINGPTTPGDLSIYNACDSKITGTITIGISIDGGTEIVRTTSASAIGSGLKIILHTDKVGWYNSAVVGLTDTDITLTTVDINVNGV